AHVRRELGDDLSTRPAGCRQLVVVDDDRDRVVVLRLPGCDRGEYRAALRADRQSVRRVLHVRAGVDLVSLGAHGRANLVLRVRRVGPLTGKGRDADEVLVPRPELLHSDALTLRHLLDDANAADAPSLDALDDELRASRLHGLARFRESTELGNDE